MANNESITGKFLLDLEEVMSEICNGYCKYYDETEDENFDELLEKHCSECPMKKVVRGRNMISGKEER